MREKLTQYVNLLFAGNPDAEDVRQEILQNTLDRFDDLVEQGKSPEAAYSLAISGIGDVSELIGAEPSVPTQPARLEAKPVEDTAATKKIKAMQAVAIALYICCVIPVIALANVGDGILGVCLMFLLIAAATALIIIAGSSEKKEPKPEPGVQTPQKELEKVIGTITLAIYLAVSFISGAWHITWLIFPISGAVKGLVRAIRDLKEANKNET